MTIKQQGGIFGRNPTFNEVEVDSKLTTDGIRYDPTQDGGYGGSVFVRGGTAIGGSQGQLFGGIAFGSSDRISTAAIAAAQTGSNNDNVGLAFYTHSTNPQNDAAIKAFDVTHTGNIAFPSGQGIDFSATSGTGTSELFNDYEEGTWTPSYTPTTGSFTTMTYNNQEGYYTKIGDLVYINCLISTNNSNPSGGSGVLLISGLPYTCGASADHSLAISGTVNWGGDYPLAGQLIESSSTIKFQYRTVVNGTTSSLDVSDMATSTSSNRNYIRFSGCYKV